MPNTADLLEESAALKAMLTAADARDRRKDERIERLEKLVAVSGRRSQAGGLRQAAVGRKSEKSDPDQFEPALEDLETAMAAIHAEEDAEDRAAKRPAKPRAANRGSLPKHLPRIEEVIEPDSLTCACGGCLHCIGEDVSERLDIMSAQFRVIVTRRPKICLPLLHGWCGSGRCACTADPGWHADGSHARPCAGQHARGSPAALPSGPDMQPPRC